MGKQMTRILKTKAKQLYSLYPEKFTDNFGDNKKGIDELSLFGYSKIDRNMVAGFITRLKANEKKE